MKERNCKCLTLVIFVITVQMPLIYLILLHVLFRAMQGKRLLELARAKNKKVVAPPSTIVTKSSKP